MPSDNRQELIETIERLPAILEAVVSDLTEAQLDAPGGDGDWTVRQVVHHIADSHMNSLIRMKLMLTEEHPTLKPYDQEQWADLPDTNALPIAPSLAILRGLHARWTALLRGLPETAWSRTGFHPENGEVTIDSMLESYAHHGQDHVEQIKRLRALHGW